MLSGLLAGMVQSVCTYYYYHQHHRRRRRRRCCCFEALIFGDILIPMATAYNDLYMQRHTF
jgi:hypothetical protein